MPVLIGIAAGSANGKTTIALGLIHALEQDAVLGFSGFSRLLSRR